MESQKKRKRLTQKQKIQVLIDNMWGIREKNLESSANESYCNTPVQLLRRIIKEDINEINIEKLDFSNTQDEQIKQCIKNFKDLLVWELNSCRNAMQLLKTIGY